jgi:hypothetical protein
MGDVLDSTIRGIVIDDIRFDNEALLVRDMGGIVVEITRPNTSQMAHASEAGIARNLIDHTFDNTEDADTLKQRVLAKLYYVEP